MKTITYLLFTMAAVTSIAARADDGDLQRALLEAACANAKVIRLPAVGKTEIYEANCLGTSHKRIKIVCIAGRCVADRLKAEQDDPEEQN